MSVYKCIVLSAVAMGVFLSIAAFKVAYTQAPKISHQPSDVRDQKTDSQFTGAPTRIIIPSAGISLPVIHAKVAFNTWEVSLAGASFGDGTTLPGNPGNTVIFSHALPTLFGSLPKVKKGDIIHVFTDNDWFAYRVTERFVVDPGKTDIISSTSKKELTLYTCTGDNYSQRLIIKASLIPAI